MSAGCTAGASSVFSAPESKLDLKQTRNHQVQFLSHRSHLGSWGSSSWAQTRGFSSVFCEVSWTVSLLVSAGASKTRWRTANAFTQTWFWFWFRAANPLSPSSSSHLQLHEEEQTSGSSWEPTFGSLNKLIYWFIDWINLTDGPNFIIFFKWT